MAIHFDAKNNADAWAARDHYRILMLLCLVGLPLLVWVMARLPRLTGGKGAAPPKRGDVERIYLRTFRLPADSLPLSEIIS